MRILFIHPNFPAQFVHLLRALRLNAEQNKLVFLTAREEGSLSNVYKAIYKTKRAVANETHHYIRSLESAVLQGQAAYQTAAKLKAQGFKPDLIIGHSGWGPTLYMKDLFPDSPLICYFEWFYRAHGSDAEFGPDEKISADSECRVRTKNAAILLDLYSCDAGYSPTYWQHSQFPVEYNQKIRIMHDGIDTDNCCPQPKIKLILPELNLNLTDAEEIVTYVGRGMEPYRGFPQFMETVALLLARRPKCHVVIVGSDRVAYGAELPDGKTYRQMMLEKLSLDMSRVHFTGALPKEQYIKVLQASTVHVYLTRPFVLSWSMLEAMSSGCVVVASNTKPVTEVINDGVNGLLADFFSPQDFADKIEMVLTDRKLRQALSFRARETIQERYALRKLLPRQVEFFNEVVQNCRK